jgi:hypothetical protein
MTIRAELTDQRSFQTVACGPPEIGAETSGKFSEQLWNTYRQGSVAQEGAVVNLHIGTTGINSSALKVACGPPEIGTIFFRKFFSYEMLGWS